MYGKYSVPGVQIPASPPFLLLSVCRRKGDTEDGRFEGQLSLDNGLRFEQRSPGGNVYRAGEKVKGVSHFKPPPESDPVGSPEAIYISSLYSHARVERAELRRGLQQEHPGEDGPSRHMAFCPELVFAQGSRRDGYLFLGAEIGEPVELFEFESLGIVGPNLLHGDLGPGKVNGVEVEKKILGHS